MSQFEAELDDLRTVYRKRVEAAQAAAELAREKRREAEKHYHDALEVLAGDSVEMKVLVDNIRARGRQHEIEDMLEADWLISPLSSSFRPTWERLRRSQQQIERLLAS